MQVELTASTYYGRHIGAVSTRVITKPATPAPSTARSEMARREHLRARTAHCALTHSVDLSLRRAQIFPHFRLSDLVGAGVRRSRQHPPSSGAGGREGRGASAPVQLRCFSTALPAAARIVSIPGHWGINALWDFDVLSHPLTSQMERAWLGAKK